MLKPSEQQRGTSESGVVPREFVTKSKTFHIAYSELTYCYFIEILSKAALSTSASQNHNTLVTYF